MKYTIEGFQQKKLVSYDLDVIDALILRWFIDFAATNKMTKRTIALTEKNGNSKTYLFFKIIFDAVLEEFPIFGISTKKGLSKRFDRYVEKGLLLKHVLHGGNSKGTDTYFSILPAMNELMYSEDVTETANTERNSSSVRSENDIQMQKTTIQKDSTEDSDENSSSVRNSENTSEENSNSFHLEPEFISTGTGVPFALNNPSINHSINSSSSAPADISEKEEAEKTLSEYFDIKTFSQGFVDKLVNLLEQENISPRDYITWSIGVLKKRVKQGDNLQGYFFKSATDNYFLSLYKNAVKNNLTPEAAEKHKNEITKQSMIECPVCATRHIIYDFCPGCGLRNPCDEDEIVFRKEIWKLPTEIKNKLDRELEEAAFSDNEHSTSSAERIRIIKAKKESVYKKYIPFLTHEKFITIFG